MNTPTRKTLAVLVDNEAGVLSRVVRLFSGKGYNIESLAVGTTDDPAISRITHRNPRQRRADAPHFFPAAEADLRSLRQDAQRRTRNPP